MSKVYIDKKSDGTTIEADTITEKQQTLLDEIIKHENLVSDPKDIRQITKINRFRLNPPDNQLNTRAYIFMTKPNLNLFSVGENIATKYSGVNTSSLHPDIERNQVISYIKKLGLNDNTKDDTTENLGMKILQSLEYFGTYNNSSAGNKSPWLSIITNCAKSYDPVDREIDTVNVATTFHGNKVLYAEPTFKYKTGGTISISFTDRRDLSLYYTLKTWVEYMHMVAIGLASPFRKYITRGILDYAVSLYYVVVDETMENIVYWEKLTGVFPISVPDSMFKMESQTLSETDLNYTITFAYSMRSVQYEYHLMEINALYGITSDDAKVSRAGSDVRIYGTGESAGMSLSDYAKEMHKRINGDKSSAIYTDDKTDNLHIPYDLNNKDIKVIPLWDYTNNKHGETYVTGPLITLGTHESKATSADNTTNSKFNKGQYKLRWI